MTSQTGIEFIDLAAKHWTPNNWVRGGCLYGITPANGLVYAPPHPCACYLGSMLTGFNALAADSPTRQCATRNFRRGALDRGPGYKDLDAPFSPPAADDWPVYRHDPLRSGASFDPHRQRPAASLVDCAAWPPEQPDRRRRLRSGGLDRHAYRPCPLGGVRPAAVELHGGRPRGFTSGDGRRAGVLRQCRWLGLCPSCRRRDARLAVPCAPLDRRIVSYGQLESVWPVSGSVLPAGDAICALAGRSAFLDGGLASVRLDAASGRKLSETILDYGDPEASRRLHAAR